MSNGAGMKENGGKKAAATSSVMGKEPGSNGVSYATKAKHANGGMGDQDRRSYQASADRRAQAQERERKAAQRAEWDREQAEFMAITRQLIGTLSSNKPTTAYQLATVSDVPVVAMKLTMSGVRKDDKVPVAALRQAMKHMLGNGGYTDKVVMMLAMEDGKPEPQVETGSVFLALVEGKASDLGVDVVRNNNGAEIMTVTHLSLADTETHLGTRVKLRKPIDSKQVAVGTVLCNVTFKEAVHLEIMAADSPHMSDKEELRTVRTRMQKKMEKTSQVTVSIELWERAKHEMCKDLESMYEKIPRLEKANTASRRDAVTLFVSFQSPNDNDRLNQLQELLSIGLVDTEILGLRIMISAALIKVSALSGPLGVMTRYRKYGNWTARPMVDFASKYGRPVRVAPEVDREAKFTLNTVVYQHTPLVYTEMGGRPAARQDISAAERSAGPKAKTVDAPVGGKTQDTMMPPAVPSIVVPKPSASSVPSSPRSPGVEKKAIATVMKAVAEKKRKKQPLTKAKSLRSLHSPRSPRAQAKEDNATLEAAIRRASKERKLMEEAMQAVLSAEPTTLTTQNDAAVKVAAAEMERLQELSKEETQATVMMLQRTMTLAVKDYVEPLKVSWVDSCIDHTGLTKTVAMVQFPMGQQHLVIVAFDTLTQKLWAVDVYEEHVSTSHPRGGSPTISYTRMVTHGTSRVQAVLDKATKIETCMDSDWSPNSSSDDTDGGGTVPKRC